MNTVKNLPRYSISFTVFFASPCFLSFVMSLDGLSVQVSLPSFMFSQQLLSVHFFLLSRSFLHQQLTTTPMTSPAAREL
ncbi:hypothetical protein B0T24DRAFT_628389 [Lasiosphaeria ovina]|uniref:Uncharacterized protein n=1 Tax=Lasiosphaeria ovina TaxID=92902 RepID=A0AAE0N5U6_9PEZI|nr:hypothetical protein B0T24DRAFT_628389 [Lasiosphaeria ovina]